MANEVSYANHADLRLAAVLNKMIHKRVTDVVDLRGTCMRIDSPAGSGSAAVKVPQMLLDEVAASTAEASAVSNSALGDSAATVTVARYATRYDVTDLFAITSQNASGELALIAEGLVDSGIRAMSTLITTAYGSVTATAGASGAVMSLDYFYDALFALEQADVPDTQISFVGKPKQITQLQDSIRGEGGAAQFTAEAANAIGFKPQGFKFSYAGVDVISASTTTDDSTDFAGCMYAPGAFAIAEATPEALGGIIGNTDFLRAASAGSPMWVEIERKGAEGMSSLILNYYPGVAVNEQARAVQINSGV